MKTNKEESKKKASEKNPTKRVSKAEKLRKDLITKKAKTDKNKKAMITAMEKALGIVTLACKSVGIVRETHYTWYREDEEYKKAIDEVKEVALDFAESSLHKQIKAENTSATIFYLKTKGRKRGYVERVETVSKDAFEDQFSEMSDEELIDLLDKTNDKLKS